MTGAQTVLLVVGIVAVNGAVQAAIWIPLMRRAHRVQAELPGELAASGERLLRGPERGEYRGATASGLPRAKGNALLALTERRVIVRKYLGAGAEVPLDRIAGVREEKVFLASVVAGRTHVVLSLRDGGEVAFFAADPPAWVDALRQAAGLAAA